MTKIEWTTQLNIDQCHARLAETREVSHGLSIKFPQFNRFKFELETVSTQTIGVNVHFVGELRPFQGKTKIIGTLSLKGKTPIDLLNLLQGLASLGAAWVGLTQPNLVVTAFALAFLAGAFLERRQFSKTAKAKKDHLLSCLAEQLQILTMK